MDLSFAASCGCYTIPGTLQRSWGEIVSTRRKLVTAIALVVVSLIALLVATSGDKPDGGTASRSRLPIPSRTATDGPTDTGSASIAPTQPAPTQMPPASRWTSSPSLRLKEPGRLWPFTPIPTSTVSGPRVGRSKDIREPDIQQSGGAITPRPTSSGSQAPPVSVLSRFDPVPPGIAAQLEYFQGGGDACGFGLPHFAVAIRNRPDRDFMSAPDVLDVCIYGYSSEGDVVVEVRDPSGHLVESRTLRPSDLDMFNAFPFRRIHSDPMGVYVITVTQNGLTESTRIEVRPASGPQFMGYVNDLDGLPDYGQVITAKPGDTIRVAMGGYAPNSTVQGRIYHNAHTRMSDGQAVMEYLTSHPVTVNSVGGGIWTLKTDPTDPSNQCYMFHNELVTRRMYPAPDAPEAPSVRWHVTFCLFDGALS